MSKTIGILGGMGPLATVELFRRIIALTPANRDQDHLHILIDNNPRIPDRTAAIIGNGESPVPMLIDTARNLQRAGADLIVMPCNTAHFYLPQLQPALKIPIIDMVGETVRTIREEVVVLLATDGTWTARVYDHACAAHGITLLQPKAFDQQRLMRAIYGIKSGTAPAVFQTDLAGIIATTSANGAQAAIIGCTELSLIPLSSPLPIPVYDALTVLARAAVAQARDSS